MNQHSPANSGIENDLAHKIIGFAIEIHKNLGPGLHESTYRECLFYEIKNHGIEVEELKEMPIQYKDLIIEKAYTLDILVDDKIIVEIETVDQINDMHIQKVSRYLKLGNFKLGLLINFNSPLLKNGIRRVNNLRNTSEFEKEFREEDHHS